MTQLRFVALMRLSIKGQIRGHGKERQEDDEIKAYVDELDACLIDTWFVAERATIFDRPNFEALLTQGISMHRHRVSVLLLCDNGGQPGMTMKPVCPPRLGGRGWRR